MSIGDSGTVRGNSRDIAHGGAHWTGRNRKLAADLVTTATADTTASSGRCHAARRWTLIGRSLDARWTLRRTLANALRTLAAAVWCYTERLNACERLLGYSQIMEEKRGEEAGRGKREAVDGLTHARV